MGGFAEVISFLEQADRNWTLAINASNTGSMDIFWQFFSDKLIWIPLYLGVLFFLFRRLGWKKALLAVGGMILVIVACDQFANLVKNVVHRLRPCEDPEMVANGIRLLGGHGSKYGFFSAHAANAMGFAISSVRAFKWDTDSSHHYRYYALGIIVWALLVGVSRVFVGRHFLGDVIVGFFVGILFADLIMTSAKHLDKYFIHPER